MAQRGTEYLTTGEVALELGYSTATVTRWVREGYLKARRSPSHVGKGRIRISRLEVDRLLAEIEAGDAA